MISTSTTERIPYTPPHLEGDEDAPVFYLRAGSVIERGQMEAELAGPYRAGKVWGFELKAAIRSGVMTLLADDPDLDHLVSLLDVEGEIEDADDKRLLAETRKVLAEHWPDYGDLVAQLERRREIAPIVALRRFCVGIDAPNVVFTKGRDGLVAESTLAALDPLLMSLAGNRAFALQFPPTDAEGNLPRPSPSDNAPRTSALEDESMADGRSAS